MVAQLTGGGPGTTNVYYDDTYNHSLLAPGTLNCTTAAPGTEVPWTEAIDRSQNPITLDAGQKISDPARRSIPTNALAQTLASSASITRAILTMTPTPQALIDPAALPVDPRVCTPIYPHNDIKVNTVFEVAHAHGLRTAGRTSPRPTRSSTALQGRGCKTLHTRDQRRRRLRRRRLDHRQRADSRSTTASRSQPS